MAKGEFVLSIGDDNVVLTRFLNRKVENAWLGSPDPALAQEELGEALATDPKARISVIFDTLDQSFKEEELPKVSVLDRRKVLARHINMAFPGQNLRGARLVTQTPKKTLIYELASVPLDGRVPGWIDFAQSLPNEKAGFFALAGENADISRALAPKDAVAPEGGNHWRHFIGINVTGGLRQIIEKNDRLSLTRLTQAPPADTPPGEFADMIIRDFKATITYIRRLGYQVGEALDVVVLTSVANKSALEDITWDGARSVTVYTPHEAGLMLGLGSLGREDQAFCDVLHAAWFSSKGKPTLPLTRSLAMGDTKDDLREITYLAAPYAAAAAMVALVGWAGWTGYELYDYASRNEIVQAQLSRQAAQLQEKTLKLTGFPYTAAQVRNVLEVEGSLDAGKTDLAPILKKVASSLDGDAVVLNIQILNGAVVRVPPNTPKPPPLTADIKLRLDSVIATAEEAVQTTRRLQQRLTANFSPDYKVTLTREPVAAQAKETLSGGVGSAASEVDVSETGAEQFFADFRIEKAVP